MGWRNESAFNPDVAFAMDTLRSWWRESGLEGLTPPSVYAYWGFGDALDALERIRPDFVIGFGKTLRAANPERSKVTEKMGMLAAANYRKLPHPDDFFGALSIAVASVSWNELTHDAGAAVVAAGDAAGAVLATGSIAVIVVGLGLAAVYAASLAKRARA